MKSIKAYIPNTITCCNFLCGCLATYSAILVTTKMTDNASLSLVIPLLFIILGAIFDFFDGMSARMLGVSSPIGKELDSLADATTFGLAPTTIAVMYIYTSLHDSMVALIVLLMAAFSILRLAKFNLDERQTTSFIGLATPANALFWASMIITLELLDMYCSTAGYILIILSLLSCYLLVSEIPFFSLKFHDLTWANNKIRFLFLGISALIILATIIMSIIIGTIVPIVASIACIIIIYILMALADNIINKA